jgi:putative transposase
MDTTAFRPRRHRLSAHHYREIMRGRFAVWQEVVGTARL